MKLWDIEPSFNVAIYDAKNNTTITYLDLVNRIEQFCTTLQRISEKRNLVFLLCNLSTNCISAYLACLHTQQPICLIDHQISKPLLMQLVDIYKPECIISSAIPMEIDEYHLDESMGMFFLYRISDLSTLEIHKDIAVLLSTSGSTGSPKMVKLSYQNLQSNAESIMRYLNLTEIERPITTLPMHYSYGLSILNSHFIAGSTILLTEASVVSKEFWEIIKNQKATSIAGVPYIYQMLSRLKISQMDLPSVKTFTQAGGRLSLNLQKEFADYTQSQGKRFFVMYGQTEATARISYVPHDCLLKHLGAIGIAIPNGQLELDTETGEIIYRGPNVMLGYANGRIDLCVGDQMSGFLRTGDIGSVDEDGFYYIQGRLKRFIKLYGHRINLDELEGQLERINKKTCLCVGDDERLYILVSPNTDVEVIKNQVLNIYSIPKAAFSILPIEEFSYLTTGKPDYHSMFKQVRS